MVKGLVVRVEGWEGAVGAEEMGEEKKRRMNRMGRKEEIESMVDGVRRA